MPFRLKVQICFQWVFALLVCVMSVGLVYAAFAVVMSWITGIRLPR